MRYYRRRAAGDIFGYLWDLFMERPLIGGLLIAAALAFFWLILPELEARFYSRSVKERMEYGMMTGGTMLGILVIVVIVLAMQ